MWANKAKPRKFVKWRKKALTINPKETRLVFESAEAESEYPLPLTCIESVKVEQSLPCMDESQSDSAFHGLQNEMVETDQTPSSIDKSPISLSIQGFQLSVTYYANPLEVQGKGLFDLRWLVQAFTNLSALLGVGGSVGNV